LVESRSTGLEVFGTIWEGLITTLFVSCRIQPLQVEGPWAFNHMEVAMNDTLASASHREIRPGTPLVQADAPRRHNRPATLGSIVAAWEERKRVRWELEQMSRDNPHLIDDIGLTRRQVETEIAKPFWQA
jgi:uncharacterized protein YjiS (DUF1127 family)